MNKLQEEFLKFLGNAQILSFIERQKFALNPSFEDLITIFLCKLYMKHLNHIEISSYIQNLCSSIKDTFAIYPLLLYIQKAVFYKFSLHSFFP